MSSNVALKCTGAVTFYNVGTKVYLAISFPQRPDLPYVSQSIAVTTNFGMFRSFLRLMRKKFNPPISTLNF